MSFLQPCLVSCVCVEGFPSEVRLSLSALFSRPSALLENASFQTDQIPLLQALITHCGGSRSWLLSPDSSVLCAARLGFGLGLGLPQQLYSVPAFAGTQDG